VKVDFPSAPQPSKKTEFFNTIGQLPPFNISSKWTAERPLASETSLKGYA
jgi:hypothetical protein